MAPIQLVLLLSLCSFQVSIPGVTKEPSPVFEDSAKGLQAFTNWAVATLGEPKFNQPPYQLCVVGAQPFVDKGPYVAEQISRSRPPVRSLEPYSATFHYVEPPARGAPPPKPRTLKQAIELCAKAAPVTR